MGGLRRSEAVELEWRDVTDAREEGGLLIAVRRSKTNPDSEAADVRFVKGNVARAVRALARMARRLSTRPTASSASPRRPSSERFAAGPHAPRASRPA